MPWWVSGYDPNERIIYVAGIAAHDEDEVLDVIRVASGGAETEMRFCEDDGPADPSNPPWSGKGGRFPHHPWMAWDPPAGVTCACDLVEGPHDHTVGRPGDKAAAITVVSSTETTATSTDGVQIDQAVSISAANLRLLMSFARAGASPWSDPPELQADKEGRLAPALTEAQTLLDALPPPPADE